MKIKNNFNNFIFATILCSQAIKVMTIISPAINIITQFFFIIPLLYKVISGSIILRKESMFPFYFISLFFCLIYITLILLSFTNMIVTAITYTFIFLCTFQAYSISNSYNLEKLFRYSININVLYVLYLFFTNNLGKVFIPFTYLNMNITIGFALILIIEQVRYKLDFLSLIKLIIICIGVLSYPSRGPIFFVILRLLCLFLKRIFSFKISLSFVFLLTLLFGVLNRFIQWQLSLGGYNIAYRLINNTFDPGGRPELFQKIVDALKNNPFWGYGINQSSAVIGYYPHNIFIQSWLELGIIGLLTLIILCTFVIFRYFKLKDNYILNSFFWGFLYFMAQFFKSFDMASSIPIWLLGSLILGFKINTKNNLFREKNVSISSNTYS